MARPLRIEYPGAVYHITGRGNERKTIFRDDSDREAFLYTLQRVCSRYHWFCHAYCLMGNHYHLIVETPDGNLSIGMRQLNGVFTQWFNRQHSRTGHLFQGRFKAVIIQKDSHLLEACRYVVLNPVRARMVARPDQWPWSSYRATAGLETAHSCLTVGWILSQHSVHRRKAETAYRSFVRDGIESDSIWHDLRAQSILGNEDFVESLIDRVRRRRRITDIPKSMRFAGRPSLRDIFGDIDIQNRSQRDIRITEAVEKHGYAQKEIADHLGLHFTSVSRILRKKQSC
jgi:REP element-mobilizing transposase RayT